MSCYLIWMIVLWNLYLNKIYVIVESYEHLLLRKRLCFSSTIFFQVNFKYATEDTLKRSVGRDGPMTQDDLSASILKFWKSHLSVEQCNRYIDHVYRVIQAVISAKGKYSGFEKKVIMRI